MSIKYMNCCNKCLCVINTITFKIKDYKLYILYNFIVGLSKGLIE